ncbi:MAG: T6SS immunity protein Tdi1 domain-containing protein [Pseudomonadota bacterium]
MISEIASAWGWTGLKPLSIVRDNDFGNLIVEDTSGCYWRICPEDLYCETIAHNRQALDSLFNDNDFLIDWHMQRMVEEAFNQLGALKRAHKYHLAIPGVLGGEYHASNYRIVPLIEQIRFAGDVAQQIHNLPDGAKINLNVIGTNPTIKNH